MCNLSYVTDDIEILRIAYDSWKNLFEIMIAINYSRKQLEMNTSHV